MAGTPAAGSTIEKTTRTRVIPGGSNPDAFNFWEYMENLAPGDAERHILYVYRDDPAPSIQVAKYTYPWTEIPWNDREEAEAVIAQRWGGRTFRVFVKDRSQRMGVGKITISAQPKALSPAADAPGPHISVYPGQGYAPPGYSSPVYPGQPQGPYYGDTARVAETAIHTVANQEKQAVEIGIAALKNAAEVLSTVRSTNPQPAGPGDDLMRQFMAAAITRLTNPPDPFESFLKMFSLIKELQGGTSGVPGIGGTVIDKVLTAVIDRGMNPAPAGPAVSTGAELIRVLPNIAQYVSKGMEDYARVAEAQRDAIVAQRAAVPGEVVRPGPQPVPVRPQPAPAPVQIQPPAAAAQPGAQNGEEVSMFLNPMDFIETKVLEIFNENQSAESAAEEALDFLHRMDQSIVPKLIEQGEQGLMALFNTRPILKPAMSNPARVSEFVRAFVRFARETGSDPAPAPPAMS